MAKHYISLIVEKPLEIEEDIDETEEPEVIFDIYWGGDEANYDVQLELIFMKRKDYEEFKKKLKEMM